MKCTKSCGSINSYTAPFRMHYEANPLLHVFKGKKHKNDFGHLLQNSIYLNSRKGPLRGPVREAAPRQGCHLFCASQDALHVAFVLL